MPYPLGPLDLFGWHRRAQVIAVSVSARRGWVAHVLLGRPLNQSAVYVAELHADAAAYRQKWGLE